MSDKGKSRKALYTQLNLAFEIKKNYVRFVIIILIAHQRSLQAGLYILFGTLKIH